MTLVPSRKNLAASAARFFAVLAVVLAVLLWRERRPTVPAWLTVSIGGEVVTRWPMTYYRPSALPAIVPIVDTDTVRVVILIPDPDE